MHPPAGNTPEAVDAARDKHATRERLAAAGLPTPRNFLITELSQLKQVLSRGGFMHPLCHCELLLPIWNRNV